MSDSAVTAGRAPGRVRRYLFTLTMIGGLLLPATSQALIYDFDFLGGFQLNVNTDFSLAAQMRLQERDLNIVGAANVNPAVCRSACQPHLATPPGIPSDQLPGGGWQQLGLEAEGDFVNQLGLNAPGAGGINNDDGTLNFDQYEITQAPVQINQDIELSFNDVGPIGDLKIFVRYSAFHDLVNYNRPQFIPNFFTEQDAVESRNQLSDANTPAEPAALMAPGGQFGAPQPGSPVFREVSDKYNELLGQDFDLLDAFIQGRLPTSGLFGTNIGDVQFTIGEQIINWGESTILSINSLNTINPPNVNALFRPAFLSLATVFEPVGAVKLSAPMSLNTSFEAFYQYDWEKVEIPPRGGFLSFIDVTLGDTPEENNINPGFGQATDDRGGNLRAQQQLLTGIADVSGVVPVFENEPSNDGQFGFAFTWFAPTFNNGTEFRFYYAKYNSRLPYFSAFAGQESCLQAVPRGYDDTGDLGNINDTVDLSNECPQQDTAQAVAAITQHLFGERAAEQAFLAARIGEGSNGDRDPIAGGEEAGNGITCGPNRPGSGPCAEGYPLDSFQGLLEYPEGIELYGLSFNTSFGDISFQGEIAYRPNLPLQIDDVDVAFAALNPAAPAGCAKTAVVDNRDFEGANTCVPGSADDTYFVGASVGDTGLTLDDGREITQTALDQIGMLIGQDLDLDATLSGLGLNTGDRILLSDAVGRRLAFPDFLTAYRGRTPGDIRGGRQDNPNTPENEFVQGEYIQGFERFQVLQYNIGATYVIGPGNWIRSNQIIFLFEVGANQVLGFPELDELQIEGDGTFYHASVGSDGSGAPVCPTNAQGEPVFLSDTPEPNSTRTRQANTTVCGPFQGRFNPTQQTNGYATAFSWGWRVIGIIRYENVFPGISFEPLFVIGHDVDGTMPGPGPNFIEGRQIYVMNVEMRYEQNWSVTTGFTLFRGAKPFNLLADRDFFQLGVRYRF